MPPISLKHVQALTDVARRHQWQQNANRGLNRWERLNNATYLKSRPLIVEISPTKKCNISCVFCIKYRTSGPKDMSLERYNVIARMLFPHTSRVSFCTGGDPLINPLMPEFITIADRYKVDTSITTNGLGLTEEVSRHFVLTPHMVQVALSFDGASKEMVESIRVGVDYELVLENMQRLIRMKRDTPRSRTKAYIRYSVMHRNLHELPEAVRMWGEMGADMMVIRYLDTTYGIDVHESLWFHKEEAREVFAQAVEMGKRYNISLDLPDPLDGPILSRDCTMPWRFLFLDTDGTARFCYQAWEQPIGNIFEVDDFDDLWNSEVYQRIRATVNTEDPYFPYCKICYIRRGAALETSHFHKTEESADLFTFEPPANARKRNAGIIHLTPLPANGDKPAAQPAINGTRAFVDRHEAKRQTQSNQIGEWECSRCGHITGGTADVAPYTSCPECAAPAAESRFAAYRSEAYDAAYS